MHIYMHIQIHIYIYIYIYKHTNVCTREYMSTRLISEKSYNCTQKLPFDVGKRTCCVSECVCQCTAPNKKAFMSTILALYIHTDIHTYICM